MTADTQIQFEIKTPQPDRMVVCSGCSRPLGEFSSEIRTRVGPCCAALPAAWNHGRDQGYDEDEERRPQCDACGHQHFEMFVTREVTYRIDDCSSEDDNEVYFCIGDEEQYDEGPVDTTRVRCASCTETYHGDWNWS